MTLSCVDLRWPGLFQIISRIQGKDITDEVCYVFGLIEERITDTQDGESTTTLYWWSTWFYIKPLHIMWAQLIQNIMTSQCYNTEVDVLSYDEKCKMLYLNPVIVAKHFQYRVKTFFTEVLLSKSKHIGKIVYYALCIEFQMKGSPRLHALIWTEDCSKLTSETKEAYIGYIDKHVQAL